LVLKNVVGTDSLAFFRRSFDMAKKAKKTAKKKKAKK